MKKIGKLLLSGFMILRLTGYSSSQSITTSISVTTSNETESTNENNKILVTYFSGYGNTERVANVIAYTLDADAF